MANKPTRKPWSAVTGSVHTGSGTTIEIKSNAADVLAMLDEAKVRVTTMWGLKAETYAKRNTPVQTGNLRNSMTFDADENRMILGSTVEYAPFVELGTLSKFEPPPEWIEYAEYIRKGMGGKGQRAQHMIRDAIQDHVDEYKRIMEEELKK